MGGGMGRGGSFIIIPERSGESLQVCSLPGKWCYSSSSSATCSAAWLKKKDVPQWAFSLGRRSVIVKTSLCIFGVWRKNGLVELNVSRFLHTRKKTKKKQNAHQERVLFLFTGASSNLLFLLFLKEWVTTQKRVPPFWGGIKNMYVYAYVYMYVCIYNKFINLNKHDRKWAS